MSEAPREPARAADLASEAAFILAMSGGDLGRAFEHVERQHGILVLRTQVLLSLCGIVITVTGFSGRTIAATGLISRACIIVGLFIVLAAAVVAVSGVLRLRWLTQAISDDAHETVVRCLEQREEKTRHLRRAMVLFVLGFSLYCVSIALMLASATHPLSLQI